MVDPRKVQIMTKLAAFEQKEELHALKVTEYERVDYVRIQLVKMILSVTVGYGIILALLLFGRVDYYIENFYSMDLTFFFRKIVIGYVSTLAIYLLVGVVAYHVRYRRAKRAVKEYDRNLHMLRKYYKKKGKASEES